MNATGVRRTRRAIAAAATATLALTGLAACGSSEGGPPSLNWYVNPDSGGQERIAKECTAEANGEYTIKLQRLPRDAPGQREQLIRRLAGNDTSVDIMSLDPPFIPEFAQAGYLAKVPEDVKAQVTKDVVAGALQGSTWKNELVTLPFWANTQLLWYHKSVAEQAGLDMTKPVTWDQLIEAAQKTNKRLGVQGTRAESLTVWINAMISSAGGQILENPSAEATQYQLGLDSDAGRQSAEVMQKIAKSGVAGPQLATSTEDITATEFEGPNGGFMVNWPFVWPRAQGYVKDGTMKKSTLDDYGWAMYPAMKAGEESRPPYGGVNIGISSLSKHQDLAFKAGQCIVSEKKQAAYFISDGNPPSAKAAYDDPEVLKAFPMAPLIRQSLDKSSPRPQTPYYNEITGGLQRTWQPPSVVDPNTTPKDSQSLITAILRGDALL
ncbi:MAG TPA: extracellular solute-binding protein [Actinomycetales bacterium]|nr:extracellular solute-binding protein [Actinomycetales bacterium]